MSDAGELSLRVIGGLIRYIEDHDGRSAVRDVLEGSGIEPDDFEQGRWAALAQIEHVLARARGRFADDESFTRAFAHRLVESLGPMRLLAWATSPAQLFAKGFESIDTVSTISHAEVVSVGSNHIDVRYWSDKVESRLLCLSRQGQIGALTTLAGLPPATFQESSCVGRGDGQCEYRISWVGRRRAWSLAVGVGLGCLAAALSVRLAGEPAPWLVYPAVGTLLAYLLEERRVRRQHVEFARQATQALGELARVEAEARRELVGLHERQQQWTRHLERDLADRTRAAQRLATERDAQQLAMRGVSHDLRNPLAALEILSWRMKTTVDPDDDLMRGIFDEHAAALARLRALVDELVRDSFATPASAVATIEVHALREELRRRLRALVHGKDVVVSVRVTPVAPPSIELPPIVLDRIVDNLLTNAAKYTDHGRIDLELGGDARSLVLRLSDTGRGIATERVREVFRGPRDAPAPTAGGRSFGVGLSVVVQLLARIGGRIEVASRAGDGTTFWVHLPLRVRTAEGAAAELADVDAAREIVSVRSPSSHPLARRESIPGEASRDSAPPG